MLDSHFWLSLKRLTMADGSVPVPEEAVAKAVAIFQPRPKLKGNYFFSLVPAFGGAVRDASPTRKFLYELEDEYMVQLEQTVDETGIHLAGVAHGFHDGPVFLYGDEYVAESSIVDGRFEFSAVPPGTCSLSFSQEEEDYWITGLEVREKTE